MSFSVDLPIDQISVDAGSTSPLPFVIHNESTSPDQFEVQLEGLDSEWTSAAVPLVSVASNAQHADKLFFKPPRVSESQAGSYPFALRVRSMETGESKVVQGILTIRPFHYLSMEVAPKRGVFSATKKENVFVATIMNLGNTEHSLQVFGNDPDDALSFVFSHEQVVLGPGQSKAVEATVSPIAYKPFAGSRLHGLSIGARSIDTPSVACSAQAQLEQKALVSPGTVALAIFVIAMFVGWLMLLPKPPEMEFLRLSKNRAYIGETIKVSWKADNAERVRIQLGTNNLITTPETFGSYEFVADSSGTIKAVAMMGSKQSDSLFEQLVVEPKPIVPIPQIAQFSITPRTVNKGEKLTVRYAVEGPVTKLTLAPNGMVLDPKIDTIFVDADVVGTITYKLVAENAEGKTAEKSITVTVSDPTLPRVDEFIANPSVVEGESGATVVSWRTANAVRIELMNGAEKFESSEASGSREFMIDKTTEFVLTVYDSQNRKVSKRLRVELKVVPTIDPGDPTSTGGGPSRTTTTGDRR